ncbi:MAG TPA: hypothetical protein H9694_11630 [Firmicutes bacterium]|nr:hypothetical protein [Bacillota bacterium]
MKKRKVVFSLLLALSLALGLCACSGGDSQDGGSGGADASKGLSSAITVNGASLALGGEFTNDMQSALGEPENVVQAPSCHYDGTDNIYYYAGVTVYTYMQDDKSIVYSVEVSDAAYPTPEGVKVGMTLDEAKALCGDGAEEITNGVSYSLGNGMELNLRATDGKISTIEYYTE